MESQLQRPHAKYTEQMVETRSIPPRRRRMPSVWRKYEHAQVQECEKQQLENALNIYLLASACLAL